MYPDPITFELMHSQLISETLERHGPDHMRRVPAPFPGPRPLQWLRHIAACAMYRLADSIDSAPRASHMPAALERTPPKGTPG